MTVQPLDEEAIFHAARAIASPVIRADYLSQACGDNQTLRARVEGLLKVYADEKSFAGMPAAVLATIEHQPISERPGTLVGRYKLLEEIGEGGFGVVFMAEQQEPVRRKVALKLIKPGMDTRQIIARFEAERQALALMEHPHIAKVLDAGATESGRPYFVMELVRGTPITDYCDKNHLTPRQRLELFVPVCQAVQHAHQKGIIHRDLKPTNVLITLHDGVPVPKVIDFGIAKATGQQLTEKTLFTNFAQMVGTPLYMSPEQAELSGLDVDTRSDIYSLGVLLYELLTGSTPFDQERFRQATFDEIRRIIREEEPQKPSTRLSSLSLGERAGVRVPTELSSIAANRGLEPKKLSGLVSGELDWIVMKALEKDRNRRYETANGLAADVQHYLNDEAVQACPPSAAYRFRKFARRNKSPLAFTGLGLLILLILTGGIGWNMRDRAAREEQLALERRARQAKVSGQLELILDEVARLEQAEKWPEALVSARRAEPALAAGEAPSEIQERVRQTLADLELVRRLDEIRAKSGTVWVTDTALILAAQADQEYTAALRQVGIDVDALPVKQAVDRITARRPIAAALLPALDDWVAVRSIGIDQAATRRLIDVLHGADPDPWRQRVRVVLARKDWPALDNLVTSADLDRQPAATLCFLYAALWPSGKHLEQELVLRRAQRKYPADYWINHRLGVMLTFRQSANDVRDGIGFMRAAVAVRPESAHAVMNLGNGYAFLGQYDDAIACHRKALEFQPGSWAIYTNLGVALGRKDLYEDAIVTLEEAIKLTPNPVTVTEAYSELSLIHSSRADAQLRNARLAADMAGKAIELEPQASNNWTAFGIARYRQSQWQEARTAFDKSLQLGTDGAGGAKRWAEAIDWFFLAMSHWRLGQQDQARQCYDRAIEWMEKQQTDDEQLRRFRAEAAELLTITDQKPTTKPPVKVK